MSPRRVVLHLLPVDAARGAQRYARVLCDRLDSADEHHRLLTIFAAPGHPPSSDSLGITSGRLRRWGFDPRARRRLRTYVRNERPALIVAHGGEPLLYAALLGRARPRLVYYKIGPSRFANRAHRALYRRVARRADAVAAVSGEMLDEAASELAVPDEQLWLVPNGRDPGSFAGTPVARSDGAVRLLWVGELNDDKRPDRFLDVVDAVARRNVDVDATVVGDGPLRATLAGAHPDVAFLGSRDDVPELLAAADIVCFTSDGIEGMPGILIEAGLAARPVVTTRVPGASTVVESGVTGFVVDVGDNGGFVDAVVALVADPDGRRTMGEAARLRCVEKFSLESSAARWRELLARLFPSP